MCKRECGYNTSTFTGFWIPVPVWIQSPSHIVFEFTLNVNILDQTVPIPHILLQICCILWPIWNNWHTHIAFLYLSFAIFCSFQATPGSSDSPKHAYPSHLKTLNCSKIWVVNVSVFETLKLFFKVLFFSFSKPINPTYHYVYCCGFVSFFHIGELYSHSSCFGLNIKHRVN